MRIVAFVFVAACLVAPGPMALAQQADPAQVEAGMRIYNSDGADCEFCHGWSGAGRQHNVNFSDTVAWGNSLVDSKMTREQMIAIISCGKRGNGLMPRYRGDSWTAGYRCEGKVAAEQVDPPIPLQGMRQLTQGQIESVVAFIQTIYQGAGMNVETCAKYWGTNTANRACDPFRR